MGKKTPAYLAQPPGVDEAVCIGMGDAGEMVGDTGKGVRVGREVLVAVGVGDIYHLDVGVGVRVGG